MAKRYFNWTLVVVLVVGSGVFAAAVFALHRWQVSTRAEQALPEGMQAYEQKDWDAAAGRLGQYLSTHGDDVPILLKYAEAQRKRRPMTPGHIEQAVGVYRSVLRLDPNNTEAAKGLVELYFIKAERGQPTLSDAEDVASRFLEKKDDLTLTRYLALAMRGQGKVPEAQATLERLVKAHPEDALAYELLGRLAEAQGTDANRPAASWFDEAVTVNPRLAAAYLVRAEFFLRKGDRDKAVADLAQAEKCDLSDYDVRLRLAAILTGINDLERARGHLKALQAQDPTQVGLWQTWMILARRSGSLEEMATVGEAGLKALGSERWDFMPAATEAFIYAGRIDLASDCIAQMRAKELIPGHVAYLEGLLADKQGRLGEAVKAWRRSLSLDSSARKNQNTRIQLAAALERLGDLPSAISQLRSLTSEWPDYAEGHVRLARYLIQTGDWASARKEVERFTRDNRNLDASIVEVQARILLAGQGSGSAPDREREWQAIDARLEELDKATGGNPQVRLLQAQAAVRQGKPTEAEKLLDDVGKERPSDWQVNLLQAEMLIGQNKPDDAITLLRATVEQFPQAFKPVRQLAILLNRQKDQAQCEAVIKQAIARLQRPEDRRDLGLLLADLYRFWGREDDAQQWLADLAQQFPKDIQVTRGLLACPTVIRNTAQAQSLVDAIKSLEGDAGRQWRYEQASVWLHANSDKDSYSQSTLFKKDYYSQAVALLQENLRANPDDEDTRLMLARVHELAGQQQLALSTYRDALARSPDNLEVIQRTVLALFNAGDVDEAQKIIATAAERPLFHPALEKLELAGQKLQWRAQLQRGAFDSAAEILREVLDQDPNDLSASLSLALISMRQGRLDEAAILLKQLRAKAPKAINVIEAQAQLYLLQGNAPEALKVCDDLIRMQNSAVSYRIRAKVYAELREKDKAVSDFSQAVAMDPNNAGAWLDRAGYYQQIGLQREAVADLRQALALASNASAVLKGVLPVCLTSGSSSLMREAEAALDKARSASADDLDLKVLKASFLLTSWTRPSIEQSQRLLREVTEAEPRYAEAWRMLGSLELGQGQPARALDTVLRGLSFNENSEPLALLRADAAAAYSPALAVPTLKRLMESRPGNWEVERRLAGALYKSGDKSEGRSMLDARIQADPNDPVSVLTLTDLLIGDKDWEGVTQQVTAWRTRHPDDIGVAMRVAAMLAASRNADTGVLQTAENLARAGLNRDPNSVAAFRVLALLTQKLGRIDESIGFARKILEREPNDLVILNNLAWALCEDKGQYQEALALADRGLKVAPEYVDLIDTRGVIHYRLNHLEKAAQDFGACLDLYIADAPQIAATRFHLGRVYAKMGRRSQAQEQLKQALDQQRTLEQQNRAGSLSPADVAEIKSLLEPLQKGE